MKIRDTLSRLDRAQHSLWFKIIASVVVAALGVAAITAHVVVARASQSDYRVQVVEPRPPPPDANLTAEEKAAREAARSIAEANARQINDVLSAHADVTGVVVGVAVLTALAEAVVWLGLGLTSLAVLLVLACISAPLEYFGNQRAADVGKFIASIGVLTMAFSVLMELLKILYGGPWRVLAIARNVINEAVRLKVSLVFIILLIFGLASLPGLLDAGTPLRYRVQLFLSYGTGGTFWVIAVLVLFLSVGTVAFEQRDRVIWQTMTKPVAAWQYLLGKWLGVVGVAAVLLTVSASGVFLFTEYLSGQTAVGEVRPFVARNGETLTEDREALQTQVLSARLAVRPDLPAPTKDDLTAQVKDRIDRLRASDPIGFKETQQLVIDTYRDIADEMKTRFLSIEPNQGRTFVFRGLKTAKEENQLLHLRYKINVGGNDPRTVYRLTFFIPNQPAPFIREVPLNLTLTMPIPASAIDDDGLLKLTVGNADLERQVANPETLTFPTDGLEVFYKVGSYRLNFARVMVILWFKLAFLAMVAITAATFLSFAVASMVAFGAFIIAEGAGFIWESLNYYDAEVEGKLLIHRLIIRIIALPIAWAFRFYSEMKPTENLVDGRLVAWGQVATAFLLLGTTTAVLYGIGVAIFRQRELATYSGQ